jgi:hypothetical protein
LNREITLKFQARTTKVRSVTDKDARNQKRKKKNFISADSGYFFIANVMSLSHAVHKLKNIVTGEHPPVFPVAVSARLQPFVPPSLSSTPLYYVGVVDRVNTAGVTERIAVIITARHIYLTNSYSHILRTLTPEAVIRTIGPDGRPALVVPGEFEMGLTLVFDEFSEFSKVYNALYGMSSYRRYSLGIPASYAVFTPSERAAAYSLRSSLADIPPPLVPDTQPLPTPAQSHLGRSSTSPYATEFIIEGINIGSKLLVPPDSYVEIYGPPNTFLNAGDFIDEHSPKPHDAEPTQKKHKNRALIPEGWKLLYRSECAQKTERPMWQPFRFSGRATDELKTLLIFSVYRTVGSDSKFVGTAEREVGQLLGTKRQLVELSNQRKKEKATIKGKKYLSPGSLIVSCFEMREPAMLPTPPLSARSMERRLSLPVSPSPPCRIPQLATATGLQSTTA